MVDRSIKDKIIEYLKDNGVSNVSELQKFVGCGRQTIYNAIKELESEGIIRTKKKGKVREVYLIAHIPMYLKIMIISTVIITLISFYTLSTTPNTYIRMYNDTKVVVVDNTSNVMYALLSFLAGLWFGVVLFKFDDLINTIDIVKRSILRKTKFDKSDRI